MPNQKSQCRAVEMLVDLNDSTRGCAVLTCARNAPWHGALRNARRSKRSSPHVVARIGQLPAKVSAGVISKARVYMEMWVTTQSMSILNASLAWTKVVISAYPTALV